MFMTTGRFRAWTALLDLLIVFRLDLFTVLVWLAGSLCLGVPMTTGMVGSEFSCTTISSVSWLFMNSTWSLYVGSLSVAAT